MRVHRSLTEKIMIAGVPREIAILNGTFTAALVLGMHSIFSIPLGIALHVIAREAAKSDPEFFHTFKRQIKQARYYEV